MPVRHACGTSEIFWYGLGGRMGKINAEVIADGFFKFGIVAEAA